MPRKVRKGHRGGEKLRLRRLTRSLYEVPVAGNLLGIDTPHESWMTPPAQQPIPTRLEKPVVARDILWKLHKIDFAPRITRPPLPYPLAPGDPRVHVIKTPPRPAGPSIISVLKLKTRPVAVTKRIYARYVIKINEETRPLIKFYQSQQRKNKLSNV